jgi:hypothetical protein
VRVVEIEVIEFAVMGYDIDFGKQRRAVHVLSSSD